MLTELKPGQEDPDDYQLLNDLTATCKYEDKDRHAISNKSLIPIYLSEKCNLVLSI